MDVVEPGDRGKKRPGLSGQSRRVFLPGCGRAADDSGECAAEDAASGRTA